MASSPFPSPRAKKQATGLMDRRLPLGVGTVSLAGSSPGGCQEAWQPQPWGTSDTRSWQCLARTHPSWTAESVDCWVALSNLVPFLRSSATWQLAGSCADSKERLAQHQCQSLELCPIFPSFPSPRCPPQVLRFAHFSLCPPSSA